MYHMHIQRLFAGMQKASPSPAIIDLYIHHFLQWKLVLILKLIIEEDWWPGKHNADLFSILNLSAAMDAYDIHNYHPTDNTYKTFTAVLCMSWDVDSETYVQ